MMMKNAIQSEKSFAFKTDRISKQVRTVDVQKKLQNTVVGKRKMVKTDVTHGLPRKIL